MLLDIAHYITHISQTLVDWCKAWFKQQSFNTAKYTIYIEPNLLVTHLTNAKRGERAIAVQ